REQIKKVLLFYKPCQKEIIQYLKEYKKVVKKEEWSTLQMGLKKKFCEINSIQREERAEFFKI
ncbi:hypothetical protein K469DRAFT_812933, partial [Zopfia rhizophila CBS 207.26]